MQPPAPGTPVAPPVDARAPGHERRVRAHDVLSWTESAIPEADAVSIGNDSYDGSIGQSLVAPERTRAVDRFPDDAGVDRKGMSIVAGRVRDTVIEFPRTTGQP